MPARSTLATKRASGSGARGVARAELLHDLEGVSHGLHGQAAAHVQRDVERLRDLAIRRTQVEDLLHAVLDSLPAVGDDGHRQRGQLLVLLRERALAEHFARHRAHGRGHAHGRVTDVLIEMAAARLALRRPEMRRDGIHGALLFGRMVAWAPQLTPSTEEPRMTDAK